MAITFSGLERTITLGTPGMVSVREIWSRYVDWLALGDNSKYHEMLFTVGRDTSDIPFYLFLADDVTVVVADNSTPTTIYDGVLKTYDERDPFGGETVNVRYQAPGIAIGYASDGATGPTAESIAAAVVAALQATPIPVDTRKMNGYTIIGDGSESNLWRGVGVSP